MGSHDCMNIQSLRFVAVAIPNDFAPWTDMCADFAVSDPISAHLGSDQTRANGPAMGGRMAAACCGRRLQLKFRNRPEADVQVTIPAVLLVAQDFS